MAILHLGLALGAAAFLYVGWASWNAGYGPEIAVVRGLIAFMAVTFVGYIGELIVATAPPARQDAGAEPEQPATEPPTSITSLQRARDEAAASADNDESAPADQQRRAA